MIRDRDHVAWRRRCLISAGFPAGTARDLAIDDHIDIHALLELTDRGCPPLLAIRILAPLDSLPSEEP